MCTFRGWTLHMYLVFTRIPGESYGRCLRSLLLCLCDVFQAPINSLGCCFFYVSQVNWCFTPSQPVRLYQGERGTHTHTKGQENNNKHFQKRCHTQKTHSTCVLLSGFARDVLLSGFAGDVLLSGFAGDVLLQL